MNNYVTIMRTLLGVAVIVIFAITIAGCAGTYKTEFACPVGTDNDVIILHFANNVVSESLGLKADPSAEYVAHIGEINGKPFVEIRTNTRENLSLKGNDRRSADQLLTSLEDRLHKIIQGETDHFVTVTTEASVNSSQYREYLNRALRIVRRFNSKE